MKIKAQLSLLLMAVVAGLALGFTFASPSRELRAEDAPGEAVETGRPVRLARDHGERGERPRREGERGERGSEERESREERLHRRAEELERHERELRERQRDLRIRRMEQELEARHMEMERGGLDSHRQILALVEDVREVAGDPVASAVSATFAVEHNVEEPGRAVDIFEDLLPDIENETVARAVRLRLVDLCGRAGRHDRALDHLRELIVAVPPDDELFEDEDEGDDEDEVWDEEEDEEWHEEGDEHRDEEGEG